MMGRIQEAVRVEFHWRQVRKNGRELSVCRSLAFFTALSLGLWGSAIAGPTGGSITAGSGEIINNGPRTDIQQGTRRLDIDWQSFSTQPHESVNFQQPDRLSTAINRVVGGVPSELRGALNANGRVFILNESGITFYGTSQVNVGALLATTARNVFEAPEGFRFEDGAAASVINHGNIQVSPGGFAVLVAPHVANTGLIQADLGEVELGAATAFTLDLRGDDLIRYSVAADAIGVDNAGTLRARSGKVTVTTGNANDAVKGVVNLGGIVDADSFGSGPGGVVLVKAERTNVTGDVSADGSRGGEVRVLGDEIALSGGRVSASGPAGGGEVLIGGDFQGKGGVYTARNTSVDGASRVAADATVDGDGGRVIVWSDGVTTVHGEITARGGPAGGDGGFIETSGKKELVFSRAADASAPNGAPGTWLLDPENIDIGRGEADAIEDSLNQGNNVSIKTGSEGEGEGNIAVNSSITKSEGDDAALSMDAHGQIDVNAPITSTSGKLDVKMKAGRAVNVNSSIETNGGNVSTRLTGVPEEPPAEEVVEVEPQDQPQGEQPDSGAEETAEAGGEEDASTPDPVEQEVAEAAGGDDGETGEETGSSDESGVVADNGEDASPASDEPVEDSIAEATQAADSQSEPDPEIIAEPELRPSFNLDGAIVTGGGSIEVEAVDGVANLNGVLDASNPNEGETGGVVTVFADEINVGSEAVIDVSGDGGGGTALIGGELQGKGDSPTATKTTVADGAVIRADAVTEGDGGTVIVWADERTEFYGDISARGGANSGDGGFIEVSGKQQLVFRGQVDARAPMGEVGTLLLDPESIRIANGAAPSGDTNTNLTLGTPNVIDTSLTSTETNVTVYEEDLENLDAGVVLIAGQSVTLEDLEDDDLEMKHSIKLFVTDDSGSIAFEDLGTGTGTTTTGGLDDDVADKISVATGRGQTGGSPPDVRIVLGAHDTSTVGSSLNTVTPAENVAITVGGLEARDTDTDGSGGTGDSMASANVILRSNGGDIEVYGDIYVYAANNALVSGSPAAVAGLLIDATASSDSGDVTLHRTTTVQALIDDSDGTAGRATASVDIDAANVRFGDDLTVDASVVGVDSSATANAYLYVTAGVHGTSGEINVDGNVLVDANASNSSSAPANARAKADLRSADDIEFDGSLTITVYVETAASTGFGSANLYMHAGSGTATSVHSDANINIRGPVLVSAEVKDYVLSNGVGTALAQASIYAAQNLTLGDPASVSADAVTVKAEATQIFNIGADADADARLYLYAGSHSSGDLTAYGRLVVDADAVGGAFGDADADARATLLAADDITLDAGTAGTAIDVSALVDNSSTVGSGRAYAYLYAEAGLGSHISSTEGDEGDLDITGKVSVTATEQGYLEAGGPEAVAVAYLKAGDDVFIDVGSASNTAVEVRAVSNTAYFDDVAARSYLYIHGGLLTDSSYPGHGSAGDVDITGTLRSEAVVSAYYGLADADADLLVLAGDNLEISGDVNVFADADANGSSGSGDATANAYLEMRAGTHDSTRAFLEVEGQVEVVATADTINSVGDANAYADAVLYASRDITLGTASALSVDVVTVRADASAGTYFDANADADARLYLYAGSHSSGDLTAYGRLVVDADAVAGYAGNAHADATVTLLAADDITLDAGASGTAIDVSALVDNSGLTGSGRAYAYLYAEAGLGSHISSTEGDEGDLDITGKVSVMAAEQGFLDSGDSEAEAVAYLKAGDDVFIDVGSASNTAVFVKSLSGVAHSEPVAGRSYLYIHAGLLTDSSYPGHGSAGDVDITGALRSEAVVSAVYGGANADADLLVLAGDNLEISGDVNVFADADANGSSGSGDATANAYLEMRAGTHDSTRAFLEVEGQVEAVATADVTNPSGDADAAADAVLYASRDITLGTSSALSVDVVTVRADASAGSAFGIDANADADARLYVYAGSHSSGDLIAYGRLVVDADAVGGYSANAYADALATLLAADDITLDAGTAGTAIDVSALVDNSSSIGSGRAYAYLYAEAGMGTHISSTEDDEGDLDITGKVSVVATEQGYLDSGSPEAEAVAHLKAGDDVFIDVGSASNTAVEVRAVSNTAYLEGVTARSYLYIHGGLLTDSSYPGHGSAGDVDITGTLRSEAVVASAYGGANADADLWVLAGDDLEISGDVDVLADADANASVANATADAYLQMRAGTHDSTRSFIEVAGEVEVVATADANNSYGRANADADAVFYASRDITLGTSSALSVDVVTVRADANAGTYSGGNADADARLYVYAGSHSSGDLTAYGRLVVDADAVGGSGADAHADALATLLAADDITLDAGTAGTAIDVSARVTNDNSPTAASGAAIAYLYVEAGLPAHISSTEGDEGDLAITGRVDVLASEAGYFGQASTEARASAYLLAGDDLTIDVGLSSNTAVQVEAESRYAYQDDNVLARSYLYIHGGTLTGDEHGSQGDVEITGRLRTTAEATGYGGSADAELRVLAGDNLTVSGDVDVLARADTDSNGSGSGFARADADLYMQAGTHNSDGDLAVTGQTEVTANAGTQSTPRGADAFAEAYFYAGRDITLGTSSALSVDVVTVKASASGGFDGGATADAMMYAYAGSHSSGEFSAYGGIVVDADAVSVAEAAARSRAEIVAANHVFMDAGTGGTAIEVTADADTTSTGSGVSYAGVVASADLVVRAGIHGSGSSASGDITIEGDVLATARALSPRNNASARAYIELDAVDSHVGGDDDLLVIGDIVAYAAGLSGTDSTDSLNVDAEVVLKAGDDIIIIGQPPFASAALAGSPDVVRRSCNQMSDCSDTASTAGPVGSESVNFAASLDFEFHDELLLNPEDLPINELAVSYGGTTTPDTPVPTPGVVSGGPGIVTPPGPPVIPPGTPVDGALSVLERSVVSWLVSIQQSPDFLETLPPVIADGFRVEDGEVIFATSFVDFFNSAYWAGLCNWVECDLEDILQALEDADGESTGGQARQADDADPPPDSNLQARSGRDDSGSDSG